MRFQEFCRFPPNFFSRNCPSPPKGRFSSAGFLCHARWYKMNSVLPGEPGSITSSGTPGGPSLASGRSPSGTREAEMGLEGRRHIHLKSVSCSIVLPHLSFLLPAADKPRGAANSTVALGFGSKASQFWFRPSPIYVLPLHSPSHFLQPFSRFPTLRLPASTVTFPWNLCFPCLTT